MHISKSIMISLRSLHYCCTMVVDTHRQSSKTKSGTSQCIGTLIGPKSSMAHMFAYQGMDKARGAFSLFIHHSPLFCTYSGCHMTCSHSPESCTEVCIP